MVFIRPLVLLLIPILLSGCVRPGQLIPIGEGTPPLFLSERPSLRILQINAPESAPAGSPFVVTIEFEGENCQPVSIGPYREQISEGVETWTLKVVPVEIIDTSRCTGPASGSLSIAVVEDVGRLVLRAHESSADEVTAVINIGE